MRSNMFKSLLVKTGLAASVLLLHSGVVLAQQQVNLTAAQMNATMPDGSLVPMWGYSCGTVVVGSTATCAKLNPSATGWSPVVITVPTAASGGLAINLTNSLPDSVPTSITIVGQLGGGLGTTATTVASPPHAVQGATWPVNDPTTTNTPPPQGNRVQSFSTQVATNATTLLPAWASLQPGTYLIESGTHPSIQGPMGLYGILVVTDALTHTAYPGITYGAEIPLLFSEIDPVQNSAVSTATHTAGFSENMVWSGQPGGCGNPASPTYNRCYPPAVNYTPLYYLINGVAFDKSNVARSLFPTTPALAVTGNVLVRMVNAGLRMHVPSIVGAQTDGALPGFGLIAEDGNPLPGVTRVQSEVFMAPGKTYDVTINVPVDGTALPIYDRELSLSGNATSRDAGMLAYISVNGAPAPSAAALGGAVANADTYNSVVPNVTLTVSDPAKGLLANDVNVYGTKVLGAPVAGLTLNTDGTFSYTGPPTTFTYCGNGATSGSACALVTLGVAPIESAAGITCSVPNPTYTSAVATSLSIKPSGLLAFCKDAAGYPLKVAMGGANAPVGSAGLTLSVDSSGAFNASVAAPGTYTITFHAQNSQNTVGAAAVARVVFPAATGLQVTLIDGKTKAPLAPQDYRWIIEEDKTFFIDPKCTANPPPAGCATAGGIVPTFGTNFHTSYMPVVAQGCTGTVSCESGQSFINPSTGADVAAVCDIANGACRPGASKKVVLPSSVVLDVHKRYYISVLPGDAVDPGHSMGGAQIIPTCTTPPSTGCSFSPVAVIVEPNPLPPAKLSVFVFEDDFPLNGEHDASGGGNNVAPNEPGLGTFNITIFDDVGGTGDPAGQLTFDMFNEPLSNSLAGMIDPVTQLDACPLSKDARVGFDTSDGGTGLPGSPSDAGITGVIPVCPKYESDGTTLSPLAGQAVVNNLPPGRYGIVATPGADRIQRGEEWLQTNTLDGGKAHDSFLRVSEPSFFQEFGPAGYHVAIGFANPKVINDRKESVCAATGGCTHNITGMITGVHMSRTPDERLYGTGSRDTYGYSQCYVSLGSPDGEDFEFVKCADDGTFALTGVPSGDWKITVFDQWNDQVVDGISTPVRVGAGNVDMGEIAAHAWKQNLYTRTFIDLNGDGISQDQEPGLALASTNIRFRDGSFSNFNSTDLDGFAGFNEIFPLFNWYMVETTTTRYKNTGTHVVNDAGGPVDGSPPCGQAGYPPCGNSQIGANYARTAEDFSVPANLRVPGARYCSDADCTTTGSGSTGRVDPAWVTTYGWQGFAGQNQFLEFGKKPFASNENGGIQGHVVYASTRPFDDPALLLQLSWEPMVPHVTINLYQVGTAPDGSQALTLVDTTKTSSWDDYAQGFRSDGLPNMNCPGQSPSDPFYFTLFNQPNYLNPATSLPSNSQYKCYDGLHNWAQLQPAPYDGMYQFPSVTSRSSTTGLPTSTNCTICVTNPTGDGTKMLPPGKYVVEMVVPPGYELVKEEDKNILLGDTYEAPVTQQFLGFGNIFIMPDQAAVGATYNGKNPLIPNTDEGAQPRHEGDTGTIETFWPCVGEERVVPDYVSLFPLSGQNAPFAGAKRRLCDRKLVTLENEMTVLAKFYVFSSTHVAGHYTGIITDDATSEFDPFSPRFGEKFSPANLPVSVKDWAGNEVSRVYSDQWGAYNGLNFSSYGVNPPDPSGYVPQMMVMCMNDRGSAVAPDPLYQASYSQFCYELPFMPGQTGYFDTPVLPTTAFAEGYNHPDCAYPDATPAISEVDGDGVGPYVSASGVAHPITIHALGNQDVNNYAYSGPNQTVAPFNQKTVTRHYGFGASQGTGTVTIGGVAAAVTSWSDTTIVVTPPATVPLCNAANPSYKGANATARCGELVITAGNGKKSVDTVTVTIGGSAPKRVSSGGSIQTAIDQATAGDLILVGPGTYSEMLIMWKPVRLQGVGAASTIIDANPHPAGKLDPWRRQIVCLFGLGIDGRPESWSNACKGAGWVGFTGTRNNPQIDRLPLEATVGWDASLNGNLAEQLQEPTLMGAYSGAGITVLSKGVRFPAGSTPFTADTFPDGTTLMTPNNATGANCNTFTSNFNCAPSRIDGLSVINSSQGGGGILVHGWGHNLEISNNRVNNNQGTLTGGIQIGQGEHPEAYLAGSATNAAPGSCQTNLTTNTQEPFCFDRFVNVHHNAVTSNAGEGDELFSATPAGAGGVTFCSGADNYQFNFNWVCGNLSTGDGGGVAQLGFVYNGSMRHNAILFNQSTNPTIPTNGGGVIVMSAPDTDPTCPGPVDSDCALSIGGVSDGTGPGLVIDSNLIMGNAAESGSGGGLRFQAVNGSEVGTFPTQPARWYSVSVINNIINNNVSGWDGAGVSLQDSLVINLVNDTIISNDSTASSGALFGAFFAPQSGSPNPPPCTTPACGTLSSPQAAGVVTTQHSAEFLASLPATISCPAGHTTGSTNPLTPVPVTNGTCRTTSFPLIYNSLVWKNRAFHITVAPLSTQYQQAVVTLVPTLNQPQASATTPNGGGVIVTGGMGACVPPPAGTYWDIGVRGDTSPTSHDSGVTLTPVSSIVSSGGYATFHNSSTDPTVVKQYCNGSRVPPELGSAGYIVPPGTNEGNVPTPVFNLMANATVDEGNNWINIQWGPLASSNPITGVDLSNYALAAGSPAIDYVTSANSSTSYALAPALDYFGTSRKTNNAVDPGAIEFTGAVTPPSGLTVTGGPLNFPNTATSTTSGPLTLSVHNNGAGTVTGINLAFTSVFSRPAAGGTCGATLAGNGTCTINVVFSPTATIAYSGTLTITSSVSVTGSPVTLTGTGVAAASGLTVTGGPLNFPNTATSTTSGPLTLSVHNNGAGTVTGINLAFTSVFSRPAAGGTCGATLAGNGTCTINVVFSPTATIAYSGTLTITSSVSVTGSPVTLTGTGVGAVQSATLTPALWSPSQVRNCPGTTPAQIAACNADPTQAFTLTNTGTVTLTGIAQGTNTNVSQYAIVRASSTCGPTGNGQTVPHVTLAPGATCVITVQFRPTTASSTGTKFGVVSVTDGAGTQTSNLRGVAQ